MHELYIQSWCGWQKGTSQALVMLNSGAHSSQQAKLDFHKSDLEGLEDIQLGLIYTAVL